ncbi:hypothetical protein EXS61_01610 [Candidatus Parcubacteria bacterium]|nr:hypothetical protein [Candidatus Parcubacteria bacterium]
MTLDNGSVILRPGIVHWIDKDTSGVILVAKTQEGYEHLKNPPKERVIKKPTTLLFTTTSKLREVLFLALFVIF